MNKIQITLSAEKLRNLVTKRSYENKNGETVQLQEVKFELVPVKAESQKVIYEKDNFKIVKTHFAAAIQTKEERESKKDTFYIGDGFSHIWDNSENVEVAEVVNSTQEDDDSLPF